MEVLISREDQIYKSQGMDEELYPIVVLKITTYPYRKRGGDIYL